MSSDDSPFPQDGDGSAYMKSQIDAMMADINRQDGAAVLDRLKHIAAEVDQDFANAMLAALVQQGIDQLLILVRAGDPEAVAHAQRMLLP